MPQPLPTSRRARRASSSDVGGSVGERAAGRAGSGRRAARSGDAAWLAHRFPGTALLLAGALALGGGVATAAVVVGPPPTSPAPLAERDVTATPEPTSPASVSRGVLREGLTSTTDRVSLPTEPPASAAPVVEPVPVEPVAAPVDPDALDAAGLTVADRAAGLLSTAIPEDAGGSVVVAPGSEPAPVPTAPVRTVRVEVEEGLDIDVALFASTVMSTLNDPRGWGADGSVSFARTDGPADLRVVLASPDLVDDLCAPLDTVGKYSCGTGGAAVLNHMRWVQGGRDFVDRTQYRQYLVNHEVGHLLGHRHEQCPGAGRQAPLMQQQTESTGACTANAWPFGG